MAYIGTAPNIGENRKLDDISGSFNGSTTTFDLKVDTAYIYPGVATSLLISVGGILQEPGSAYTLHSNGKQITFTTAPGAGADFFGVVLGASIDIGTPTDDSVTTAKIADDAVTGAKLATNVDLVDNQKIRFGASNDLQIYHNGSDSYIYDAGTGSLRVDTNQLTVRNAAGDETQINAAQNGSVDLYYDNVKKLETTGTGVSISGLGANVSGNVSIARSLAVGYTDGRVPQANLDVRGNVYISGNTHMRDQQILNFGTGKDLQIYHDGADSYISDGGTGDLKIGGATNVKIQNPNGSEIMGVFTQNGAVELYYDNSKKVETTAKGISLSDASSVDISTPLLAGADHTYSGLTAQMLAGGAIAAFDLVCVHTTTQEVVEADASAYATARVIGIAPDAISDTATGTVLLHGFIRDDSWTWTPGSTLYLSETAGAMTHTAPSTDGAFVLVVGVALSPDVVYINPSMDVIERA